MTLSGLPGQSSPCDGYSGVAQTNFKRETYLVGCEERRICHWPSGFAWFGLEKFVSGIGRNNLSLSRTDSSILPSMKIRKLVGISLLVFGTLAANDVAPSNSELEAMYDRAYRAFDSANYVQALKELDAIDARKPDLAASQNLRGVIYMHQGVYDKAE